MTQNENSFKKNSRINPLPFKQIFWLSFLVISLAYAWYSFYVPSDDIDWVNDVTSMKDLTNNSDKNTLVFITGKWCSPCRIMKREVFSDQEVEKIINSQFIPVMIDIDNIITKDIIQHYKVRATPTTIIINSHGEVLYLFAGKIEKKRFLEILSEFEPK
ncbi:MAG: thioredoxin family protein [Flavobacteriales bacterium]